MKKILLGMLISVSTSAHATDWNQYVTIRKGAVVCKTAVSLEEVKRRFGKALDDPQNQEVKIYLSQSGCIRAPVDQRVHAALLEFGQAEIDVAIRRGYIPIVWLSPGNEKQYGVTFTDNLNN